MFPQTISLKALILSEINSTDYEKIANKNRSTKIDLR